jgi:SNF2 family DNA or RNA helicase
LGENSECGEAATSSSVFLQLKFYRIVFDKGHKIPNNKTETAKAFFKLKDFRRWFLSGTLIQNAKMDLFFLFKFLRFSSLDRFEVSLIVPVLYFKLTQYIIFQVCKMWIHSNLPTNKVKNKKDRHEFRDRLQLLIKMSLLRRN